MSERRDLERACLVCGALYLPRRRGGAPQKYCSSRCKARRWNLAPNHLRAMLKWRSDDPDYQKRRGRTIRALVHKGYGDKCSCCGEATPEFLTVDHINGHGAQHRKSVGSFYLWLLKMECPEGFRLLCMNCNWARRFTGRCPHEAAHVS